MRFWLKLGIMVLPVFIIISCSANIQTNNNSNSIPDVKNTAPEIKNNIIAEFDGEKITTEEFESAFQKVGIAKKENKADSLTEKVKFLDLYVNYKMKLKDALLKGLDKDAGVIKEYDDYRKSIGASMLVEKEVSSKGIKNLYERRKIEFRLKQIAIKSDSSLTDLGESKTEGILNRILKGENFDNMVIKYSNEPNVKNSGGDIYFLTSGDLNIPDIEDAVYATEAGNTIPRVFRTQYGFHILKVTEKKNRVKGVNVSHIMAAYRIDDLAPDTLAAKKKILQVQADLKSGVSFDSVAKKLSDDKASSAKGGNLGVVSRRQFLNFKNFEEAVFNLKSNEVSGIIETQAGFHILKVNEIVPLPGFEQEYESLKKIYEKSGFMKDLDLYVSRLKNEFTYKLNFPFYSKLIAVKDSFLVGDSIFISNIKNKFKDSILLHINNKPYTGDSLFNFMLNSNGIPGKRYGKDVIDDSHNKFVASVLLSEKAGLVLKNNPEFESIMEDYKNGILLFKISETEIWNKVKVDTLQIKAFWEETKNKYLTKPKVTYREIYLPTESLKDSVYAAFKSGADFGKMLEKYVKSDDNSSVTGNIDENPVAKQAYGLKNIGDITDPINNNGVWSVVRLEKKEESRIKTFEEARPEVSSVLQEKESKRLEESYINKLKETFKPKIHSEKVKN